MDADGSDKYKRILTVIWEDQSKVNLLVVAMGYAEGGPGVPCQV